MGELSALDRGGQRAHDGVLADEIGKRQGTPGTVKGHAGQPLAGRFGAPAGGYGCNESVSESGYE